MDLAFGWSLRGRCADGLGVVQDLVAARQPPDPALAWVHAFLAVYSGDLEQGHALAVAAAEREGADEWTRARSLILVGMVTAFGDPAGAEPVLVEAARLGAAAGDDWALVEASQCVAYTHLFRGRAGDALRWVDSVAGALGRLELAFVAATGATA